MNWLTSRDTIIPKCPNFRDFGHNDKISKQERNKILTTNNFSCRYCGGVYPKYLMCCYLEDAKCNDICCRLCYLITHLNYGMFREMKLYYSEMSQKLIIKETVEHIIENNDVPTPIDIDKNVKLPPISLLEYIIILSNCDKYPEELSNYKIFFTSKLGTNFITRNYGDMLFINDKNNDMVDTDKMKFDASLETHNPSAKEIELFSFLLTQK
jgi:hypothetical protein